MSVLRRVIQRIISESLLTEAVCPTCGDPNAYVGFSSVECPNPACKHFSPRQAEETKGSSGHDDHHDDDRDDDRCPQCGTPDVQDPEDCPTCLNGEPCPGCGNPTPDGDPEDCVNCHSIFRKDDFDDEGFYIGDDPYYKSTHSRP